MLRFLHVELDEANDFVERVHRHHSAAQGHKFSIGVATLEGLVGVAIVGRPVGRNAGNPREVVEVTRLATDGTRNACSALYGRCARIAELLGYLKIQTYTLASEPGTSLRASGWSDAGLRVGGHWYDAAGISRNNRHPTTMKRKWEKVFGGQSVPGSRDSSAPAPSVGESPHSASRYGW